MEHQVDLAPALVLMQQLIEDQVEVDLLEQV
jgi:hypothetical protein